MANREISEEQFLAFTSVTGTLQKMLTNPKSREMVLRAQKIVDPNVVIPELDNPVVAEVDNMKKELDAFKKSQADKEAKTEADSKVKSFTDKWEADMTKRKYTAEGVKKVEELCQQRGIADIEAGAALFEQLNPPATPIDYGESRFDMFQPPKDDKHMQELFATKGESNSAMRGLVAETLKEIRR